LSVLCQAQVEFEDFLQTDTRIFVLNTDGRIDSWDLKTLEKSTIYGRDTVGKAISIAKNKDGHVFIGTDKGIVYQIGPDLTLNKFLASKYYPIKYLIFNSESRLLLIVPNAVYDPISGHHWSRFTGHTDGLIHKKKIFRIVSVKSKAYFQMPQYVFLDSKDRLWMTASFGEFGGDLQVFDTRRMKILNHRQDSIKFGSFFPKSVFEGDDGDVFITSGLQHIMNSGEIFKIGSDLEARRIFRSEGLKKIDRKTKTVLDEGGLFVGPGVFNAMDRSITFATDRGIHKTDLKSTGGLEKPALLFNPKLTWTQEPLAVGASMAIKKMEYTSDGKLIFLTKKDGLGIYDGKRVTLLK
jgi:hypothetical protein